MNNLADQRSAMYRHTEIVRSGCLYQARYDVLLDME